MSYRRCGFRYEKKLRTHGVARIAGIDEAGRGALAGPVVAAAVILPEKFRHRRLNDSKQLAPELREEIYCELVAHPEVTWTIGIVDSIEIDRINILRASHRAMRLAIEALIEPPNHVLIDGLPVIPFLFPQTAIVVVCRDNDTLVFVEVKTRTSEDFGRPFEAVDRAKRKRISRGGLAWLRMLDNPDILFRFDVVEVIIADDAKPRLELIKNAFPLSKPYLY